MPGKIAVHSRRLAELAPEVTLLTGLEPVPTRLRFPTDVQAAAGWYGADVPPRRFLDEAAQRGLSVAHISRGFLSALRADTGMRSFSFVVDWKGPYFDAGRPTELETLIAINANRPPSTDVLSALRSARLGMYNQGRKLRADDVLPRQPFVLVIDQLQSDPSVLRGMADGSTFLRMLDAALEVFGASRVVLKPDPVTIARRTAGFLQDAARSRGVSVLTDDIDCYDLFERCAAVYTVTSITGLEALVAGVPVRCFGIPFYSGWGLTEDEGTIQRRAARPSVAQLVETVYGGYCRYVSPYFREATTFETTLDTLLELKKKFQTGPRLVTGGLTRWKRKALEPFLDRADGKPLQYRTRLRAAWAVRSGKGAFLTWGRERGIGDQSALIAEDGFIRSKGLGAAGAFPSSLVIDSEGIYFDPTRRSTFETLALETEFDARILGRARELRVQLIGARLSKYNVGVQADLPNSAGRLKILVPGQVEDDASVLLGSPITNSNRALLAAVRERHPDGYILYKPHPDVAAGYRRGAIPRDVLRSLADDVAVDVSIVDCIEWADRIETMTSLAGFEALIRDRRVTTHGCPFYSGWGLTEDLLEPPERRARTLTLDELLSVALILYPSYADPETRWPCPPEIVVRRLRESIIQSRPPTNANGQSRSLASHIRKHLER